VVSGRWYSYIIGEHGDSSVPVWSSVNIAGTRLRDMCPTAGEGPERDSEDWGQLHHEVVNAAYEIIKLKGYTSWGIGIMSAKLADAILRNQVEHDDELSVCMAQYTVGFSLIQASQTSAGNICGLIII